MVLDWSFTAKSVSQGNLDQPIPPSQDVLARCRQLVAPATLPKEPGGREFRGQRWVLGLHSRSFR